MPVNSNKRAVGRKVRIERVYPENLSSHFVSNLVVQHQPDYFTLSFFEVWPPPILGDTDEEKRAALDALDYVEANCVARLVVTPDTMREFVRIMSENLGNFEAMLQALAQSDQDE